MLRLLPIVIAWIDGTFENRAMPLPLSVSAINKSKRYAKNNLLVFV